MAGGSGRRLKAMGLLAGRRLGGVHKLNVKATSRVVGPAPPPEPNETEGGLGLPPLEEPTRHAPALTQTRLREYGAAGGLLRHRSTPPLVPSRPQQMRAPNAADLLAKAALDGADQQGERLEVLRADVIWQAGRRGGRAGGPRDGAAVALRGAAFSVRCQHPPLRASPPLPRLPTTTCSHFCRGGRRRRER